MNKIIELEALKTIREGYIAENKQREVSGDSMAYGADLFEELAEQMRALESPQPVIEADADFDAKT